MNQIRTENSFYTTPSDTDIAVAKWRSTRLDLMLIFKKEFNAYYKEAEEHLKENENFDVERDIGFIDEYALSIDYIEPDVNDTPPHWQYLISYGGPGSEIRFFVNNKSSTEPYKVEFWFLEWSTTAKYDVTGEVIIKDVWEQTILPSVSSSEGITYGDTQENTDLLGTAQETDPLLALAGTLECDVAEIKERLKNAVVPEIRVVKGPYENHPDPLIALAGTLECNVPDLGERHDDYIADALLRELWGDEDE